MVVTHLHQSGVFFAPVIAPLPARREVVRRRLRAAGTTRCILRWRPVGRDSSRGSSNGRETRSGVDHTLTTRSPFFIRECTPSAGLRRAGGDHGRLGWRTSFHMGGRGEPPGKSHVQNKVFCFASPQGSSPPFGSDRSLHQSGAPGRQWSTISSRARASYELTFVDQTVLSTRRFVFSASPARSRVQTSFRQLARAA